MNLDPQNVDWHCPAVQNPCTRCVHGDRQGHSVPLEHIQILQHLEGRKQKGSLCRHPQLLQIPWEAYSMFAGQDSHPIDKWRIWESRDTVIRSWTFQVRGRGEAVLLLFVIELFADGYVLTHYLFYHLYNLLFCLLYDSKNNLLTALSQSNSFLSQKQSTHHQYHLLIHNRNHFYRSFFQYFIYLFTFIPHPPPSLSSFLYYSLLYSLLSTFLQLSFQISLLFHNFSKTWEIVYLKVVIRSQVYSTIHFHTIKLFISLFWWIFPILFSFLFLETDINEHDHEDTPKEYIAPSSFHSYRLDNLNPSRQVRFKNQPKTSN